MSKADKNPKSRTWKLQHDITLTVSYGDSRLPLAAIAAFLGNALNYFKRRRDQLHEDVYKEGLPPEVLATSGQRVYGNCSLSHEGDNAGNYISTDNWVKAIIAAYTAATTVLDMIEEIDAYRRGATRDGWIQEVIALLDKPDGDLDAYEFVLKRVNSRRDRN